MDKIEQISRLSADILRLRQALGELDTIGGQADNQTITDFSIFQQQRSKPEPLEKFLPPLHLPMEIASHPRQAAEYIRRLLEADRQLIEAGEVPDQLSPVCLLHQPLTENLLYKLLAVLRDHYRAEIEEKHAELKKLVPYE